MFEQFRIKICGTTDSASAEAAAQLGADAVGINFYARSPRYVDPARAHLILNALPDNVEAVGVFVHQQLQYGIELMNPFSRIGTLQWHGENREPTAPGKRRWIPAFQVRNAGDLKEIDQFLEKARQQGCEPIAILVDAHAPGIPGGTGQIAPWNLLATYRPGVPLILAGGLTPNNVAEAIRTVRPNAVDVAGGVETAPGCKDADKMRRFIENAREAADRFL
jgi:phosphoribosylanthranilate isomerase